MSEQQKTKRFITIQLVLMAILILIIGLMKYNESFGIVNWETSTVADQNYQSIKSMLQSKGFENITLKPVKDLQNGGSITMQTVEYITFDGVEHKKAGTKYKKDSKVEIYYHDFPDSFIKIEQDIIDGPAITVVKNLEKMGFNKVTTKIYDDQGSEDRIPLSKTLFL